MYNFSWNAYGWSFSRTQKGGTNPLYWIELSNGLKFFITENICCIDDNKGGGIGSNPQEIIVGSQKYWSTYNIGD